MARLERFTGDVLAGRPDPGQREVLRRYATWHLMRRLHGRNNGQPVTPEQRNVVQQQVRGAVALLDWLDAGTSPWAHAARPISMTGCRAAGPPAATTPGNSSAGPPGSG
jgi:hypothetical protein